MKWDLIEWGALELEILEPYFDNLDNSYKVQWATYRDGSMVSQGIENFETINQALVFWDVFKRTFSHTRAMQKATV